MRVCVGAALTNEAVHMEGLNPTVMFAIGQRKGRKVSYNSRHQLTGRDFAAVQYDIVMNRKFNSVSNPRRPLRWWGVATLCWPVQDRSGTADSQCRSDVMLRLRLALYVRYRT